MSSSSPRTFASIAALGLAAGFASPDIAAAEQLSQMQIVGGEPVGVCGFPSVVKVGGGCTGTLIHKRAISTAQHCGPMAGTSIGFGEEGDQHQVTIKTCVGTGSQDGMLCELNEEVPMPVTPVLYGCEVDKYMQVGEDVILTGFGATDKETQGGGGDKRWGPQKIAMVEAGRTIIGDPGDSVSPCPGDSGGPVLVKVADGSFRVFGTVQGGTTGTPCNSAVDMQRIDVIVPAFEAETGLDITPCFDGATGEWDPNEECGGFASADDMGMGSWDDHCAANPVSEMNTECGDGAPPAPGGGEGGEGGEAPMGGSGGSDEPAGGAGGASSEGGAPGAAGMTSGGTPPATGGSAPAPTTPPTAMPPAGGTPSGPQVTSADKSGDEGCSCSLPGSRGAASSTWALLGLGLAGAFARMRSSRKGAKRAA